MAYTLPQGDTSNPALPSPVFGDVSAARGDHLRANNNFIWQNFTALAALFDSAGKALDSVKLGGQLASYYGTASDVSTLQGYFSDGWAKTAHESVYLTMSVANNSEIFSYLESFFAAKTAPRYVRITADAQMAGMPYPTGQGIYYVEAEANAAGGYMRVKARTFGNRSEWEALKINGEWQYGTWTVNPATVRWTQLTGANGNPPTAAFDLIIDSNAKLTAWAAGGGTYSRVLIKAGTWTLASGGVNLTAAGTKEVIGEPGSVLVFSSVATNALYYTSVSTTTEYRMYGVSINVTASGSTCVGIRNAANLINCSVTMTTTTYTSMAYTTCRNLVNCTANVSGTTSNKIGFNSCSRLSNCFGTCSATSGNAYGFYSCDCISNSSSDTTTTTGDFSCGFESCYDLTSCTAISRSSSAPAYGFSTCSRVVACEASGVSTSGVGSAFYSCTQISNCTGSGTGATGYAFNLCKKCSSNVSGTYTTSKYLTCYADAGTAVAIPAAGGDTATYNWNS